MAERFPLFVDLRGKKILVAVGGRVALRRVNTLLDFGPRITVVADRVCPELEESGREGKLALVRRPFRREDVEGSEAFVLAATGDDRVNRDICRICREKGVPVNSASDHRECDFYFPAIARGGGTVIGISGNGKNHRAVARMAARIREWTSQMRDEGTEDED